MTIYFVLNILIHIYTAQSRRQPHILFILADDLGYNDVGYHGSDINTPVLDKLAAEGVKLENYYVQPLCSPTRSQLMTGRYQIHTGIQHSLFWPLQPNGLPLTDPTLADKLQEAGYSTNIVGKWHLGFFKDEYLPTNRGFETFFGILNGKADHFKYNDSALGLNGLDLYDGNTKVNHLYQGQYSTTLYANKVVNIVENHDDAKPLFIFLSFQAVHSPLQVPEEYLKQYQHITDKNRRLYAGMTTAMDEAVGRVVESFKSKGLWKDTLLIFSTDNGGQVLEGGNNWPLRGWKGSLWEGGMRAVGFVHGEMLQRKNAISKDLIHVSDWFPTLINLAGASLKGTNPLDGIDQWSAISTGKKSSRQSILHNIDPLMPTVGEGRQGHRFDTRHRAALRHGDWKIVTGDPGNGSWIASPLALDSQSKLYERPKHKNIWLFNISNDPNENIDFSEDKPEVVEQLLEMLADFAMTSVPCFYPDNDFNADPKLHDGYWGPWVLDTPYLTTSSGLFSRTFCYLFIFGIAIVLCFIYRYIQYTHLCQTTPVKLKK